MVFHSMSPFVDLSVLLKTCLICNHCTFEVVCVLRYFGKVEYDGTRRYLPSSSLVIGLNKLYIIFAL